MNIVSISTYDSNSSGAIVIKPRADSSFRNANARVSRVATLDGGAVINHNGYSEGDRTITLKALLDETESDLMWSIFTTETMLMFSMYDGFYLMAIDRLRIVNGVMLASILIKEKIA